MTDISTAYDEIRALALTTFPNHSELINPYDIGLNDDITFEKAFGLGFGPGTNTQRELNGSLTVQREMLFTLTRKVFAGPIRTAAAMQEFRDKQKLLFEDHFSMIKEFTINNALASFNAISKIDYESDSGVEFIRVGQHDLIMLRSLFILEYYQGVN